MGEHINVTAAQFGMISGLCDEYTGRRWDGTREHLSEAVSRQAEGIAVLRAFDGWLAAIRARVLARGEPWNTATCRAQSLIDGDRAAVPDWIGQYSELASPPDLVAWETTKFDR
ncbi:hypothetical protein [Gordonia sp. (in: high G+C Gram-positive bacteria)]|uniref:hypothetical protein n=1 Tax=Gordonia sp. (in: high G+C Gram-positive bacteria) TaxID=84139 RepID=UPI00260B46A4|nr:hypothetical protein [Gordonia sp. (in: high G+C Gram-positive bacteria)]